MTADSQPAGSPIAPVRGSARGPSPGIVLLLVCAAVAGAVALAVATAPAPLPAPSAVAVVSPSAVVSASPTPAASPLAILRTQGPAPIPPTIVVLRGVTNPGQALARLAGCSPLLRVAGQAIPPIKGSDIDATAVAAGRETGWMFVPPGLQALTRVWLGRDVVELARAAGRPAVAVGRNGEVWLGGPAGAARWQPIATPAGRTAWVLTADEVTSQGHCGPWPAPARLAGQRSVTCAGVGVPACVRLVAWVGADAPDGPYPGGDMAVASPTCASGSQACRNAGLTIVAVPVGWTGTISGVRAAWASAATERFRPMTAGAAPDYALEAISPPSLPLPIEGSGSTPRACSDVLIGDLRAAPWDPRVFWVGTSTVTWPAGTTARFAGPPALTVSRSDGSYRFVEGASVRLQGSVDARSQAFVVCSAAPRSVASTIPLGS